MSDLRVSKEKRSETFAMGARNIGVLEAQY